MRVTCERLIGLLFVFGLALVQPAAAGEWNWFRAVPHGQQIDWRLLHGRADVEQKDGAFNATLHDSDDYAFVRQTLRGTISGQTVSVRVTTHGSDVGDYRLSGSIKRSCWPADGDLSGIGREILMLINEFEVIGLARTLWEPPCTPAP